MCWDMKGGMRNGEGKCGERRRQELRKDGGVVGKFNGRGMWEGKGVITEGEIYIESYERGGEIGREQ